MRVFGVRAAVERARILAGMALAPLEDPAYEPKHSPIDGRIPDVVARWAPRSQTRWFQRFGKQLGRQRHDVWDRYYCTSQEHRGLCCTSCEQDSYDDLDGHCCCEGIRASHEQERGQR